MSDREIFDWPVLPPELRYRILGFVRYPYLLLLLTIPSFAAYLDGSWTDLLKREHQRMSRRSTYLSAFVDYHFLASGAPSYLYDGQLLYRHETNGSNISLVLSLSEGRVHKWVFSKLIDELRFTLQTASCWLNLRMIWAELHLYGAKLRVRYQNGQAHCLDYRAVRHYYANGAQIALQTAATMITNSRGELQGGWVMRCSGRTLIRCTYRDDEVVTTYYEGLSGCLELAVLCKDWETAIITFALCFSPSVSLLLLRTVWQNNCSPSYWLEAQLSLKHAGRGLRQELLELAEMISPACADTAATYWQERPGGSDEE